MTDNRTVRRSCSTLLGITTAFVLPAALSTPAAAAPTARISGKVLDESGNSVKGIELSFARADDKGHGAPKLKVTEDGTFRSSFFPPGKYTIQVGGGEWSLQSMTYILKDGSGIEIMREKGNAHPERGLPPFDVGAGQRVEIEIVLASKQHQDDLAKEAALGKASGDLQRIGEMFNSGDMAGAVSAADAVLKDQPQLGTAHYLRGMALGRLERLDEAEAALRTAIDLSTEQTSMEGALGTVLLQKGQALVREGQAGQAKAVLDEAVDLLAKELARTPDSLPLLRNHAAALEAAGRREELAADLNRLIAAEPGSSEYLFRLAALQVEAGRLDDAITTLKRVPRSDKSGASLAYSIAAKFFNDGKVPQAIQVATAGVEFDSDFPPLYRLLGRAYASQGKNAEAVAALKKFLSLKPDDPDAPADRELVKHLEQRRP